MAHRASLQPLGTCVNNWARVVETESCGKDGRVAAAGVVAVLGFWSVTWGRTMTVSDHSFPHHSLVSLLFHSALLFYCLMRQPQAKNRATRVVVAVGLAITSYVVQ